MTPTIKPTLSPTASFTPWPTSEPPVLDILAPDLAETMVLTLFENQDTCQFPCFWGITPGETDWQTAKSFLQTFAIAINERGVGNQFSAYAYVPVPKEISEAALNYHFLVQDEMVELIEGPILNNSSSYSLPTILKMYGQPAEVWLITANQPREGFLGFGITLFYPQYGFLLEYFGQGDVQGDKIQRCLEENNSAISMAVWAPQDISFEEATNRTLEFSPITYHLPLEDATGIDVRTFYGTLKDPNNLICLETPASLWPGP